MKRKIPKFIAWHLRPGVENEAMDSHDPIDVEFQGPKGTTKGAVLFSTKTNAERFIKDNHLTDCATGELDLGALAKRLTLQRDEQRVTHVIADYRHVGMMADASEISGVLAAIEKAGNDAEDVQAEFLNVVLWATPKRGWWGFAN